MKRLVMALLMATSLEGAALACSCLPPPAAAEEVRAAAREMARRAVAVVEVDVVSGYDRQRQLGEQVRVRRVLAGRAPRAFRVHRNGEPNSAACGVELTPGARRFLILYPARTPTGAQPAYAIQSLCTDYWAQDPKFRALLGTQLRRHG